MTSRRDAPRLRHPSIDRRNIWLLQIKALPCETIHRWTFIHLTSRTVTMKDSSKISRRRVLTVAAGAAGTVAGVTAMVGTSTPAQAAKASQKAVKYQDSPKGEQRCDNCAQFEPPSSCKTVDGTVSPEGWCLVYAKKQE
jgi:hypothetical protein